VYQVQSEKLSFDDYLDVLRGAIARDARLVQALTARRSGADGKVLELVQQRLATMKAELAAAEG
jgi:hypothetical protein